MLTEKQKQRLSKLKTGKYGDIVIEAEKVWEKANIRPNTGIFGIIENEMFVETGCCCLIGASLVGKKPIYNRNSHIRDSVQYYYKINYDEMWAIIDGFDDFKQSIRKNSYAEAYAFGNAVRIALFINDCAV